MRRAAAVSGAVSVLWLAAFAAGRAFASPLWGIGALSALAVIVAITVPALRPPWSWRPQHVVSGLFAGVALGALLVAATRVVYPLLPPLLPSLAEDVRALYGLVPVTARTLPVVIFVVAAEELLWRGPLLKHLQQRGPLVAVLVSSSFYALAQLGSGLWILTAAALLLGSIWAATTLWLRSALAATVAHGIWTIAILGVWPLEVGLAT